MLVLDEGWDAYPELVEDVVWAPSLKESQMFTFVTIASSNRGLNLQQVCYDSQHHSMTYMVYHMFTFHHLCRQTGADTCKNVVNNLSAAIFLFTIIFSGIGGGRG